jgi:hypothetical protein
VAEPDAEKVPDTSRFELFAASAQAFLAGIPFPVPGVTGSIAAVVGYIGQRAISERQRHLLETILRRLEELSKQVDDLPAFLATDETFFSTLYYALDAVRTTHDNEKIDALANVVLNAATPNAPGEYLQHMYVRYVHELTTWHLALLACIADPLTWAKKRDYPVYSKDINPSVLFEGATRDELQLPGVHLAFLQDLYSHGLADSNINPTAMLSPSPEQIAPTITELGKRFLAFLTAPGEGEDTTPREA